MQPFFFLKPSSSFLVPGSGPILIPRGTKVHYEVELAVIVGKTLKDLSPDTFGKKEALDAIKGYSLAIDLTARNVQDEAKKKGLPWSIGKGFDTFLPISGFIPKEQIPDPYDATLSLSVNGQVKQKDMTNLMLFPIHKILSTMSSVMTLEEGDIILTGTPKGVGPLLPGDTVEAQVEVKQEVKGKIAFSVEEKPGPYIYRET